jgi:hypothetical protein
MQKSIALITIALAVVFAAVCVSSYFGDEMVPFKPPATVQVTGTVLVGGKPKAGVRVTFHPQFDIGAVKFTPNGTTNSQGNFTLSSGKPGDGAPRDEYVVTFDFPVLSSGGIEKEIDLFKGKYSDPASSRWKIKVTEKSQETFQLN